MATNKNLQSFEKLVGICTGLGETYRPGQQKLQVEAMTTLLSQAQTLVSGMIGARAKYESAMDHRVETFKGLRQFSTRLFGALAASGASAATMENARAAVRKIVGRQTIDRSAVAAQSVATTAPPPKKRRARGMDYASIPLHFEKLIDIAARANYAPNEADLQVDALRKKLADLRESNSDVIRTGEVLRQAQNDCHGALYNNDSSIYHVGQMAKQYVKSVYGFKNDNHLTLRKLPFNNKP